MKFRSLIQEWYIKLERNSPTSPHMQRKQAALLEQNVESIPILSPVSSPQSQSEQASPSTATTPPGLGSRDSLSGSSFPPTPKLAATPSTCDVLGRKKRSGGGDASATPEFPTLTPAGSKVKSERKSLDSLSMGSPLTPQLDSSPTTTIQLSPSHLEYLDSKLAGGEGGGKSIAKTGTLVDTKDVEDKLMSSLYVVS